MSVDGVMVQGNLIPIFADGLTHRVEVTMG